MYPRNTVTIERALNFMDDAQFLRYYGVRWMLLLGLHVQSIQVNNPCVKSSVHDLYKFSDFSNVLNKNYSFVLLLSMTDVVGICALIPTLEAYSGIAGNLGRYLEQGIILLYSNFWLVCCY